jgi:hypothetical protein
MHACSTQPTGVRTGPAQRPGGEVEAGVDVGPPPGAAVLVVQQDQPAVGTRASRRASVSSSRARRPEHLRLVGQQPVQQRCQPQRLVAQRRAQQGAALRRGVALGEDSPTTARTPSSRSDQLLRGGTVSAMPASRIFRLARTRRWATVGSEVCSSRASRRR